MHTQTAVVLTGLSQRRATMTWGQRTQQAIFDFLGDESYRGNLRRSVVAPPGTTIHRLRDIVAVLLTRHEALRTTYERAADGMLWQNVRGEVTVDVPLFEAADSAAADRIRDDLLRHCFDHRAELPVRFAIIATDNQHPNQQAITLDFAVSHLSADALAAFSLVTEVRELLRSPYPVLESVAPPDPQPVDRVAFEQSPEGQALSARNVARWRQFMESGVTRVPALTRAGQRPRFWAGALDSPAIQATLPAACARYRTKPSVVLLAALAAELTGVLGVDPVPIRVAFSNRMRPPDDRAVETLMQWGLACVGVGGRGDAEVMRSAGAETLRAHATARYDIYDLLQVREDLRAAGAGETYPQFFFNYVEWVPCQAPELSPDRLRALVERATFTIQADHDNDSPGLFFLAASAIDTCVKLEFLVDTELLTPAEAERIVRGIERRVTAAHDSAS